MRTTSRYDDGDDESFKFKTFIMKRMKLLIIISSIILYIIVAFGTYGYIKVVRQRDTDSSAITGLFWPFYWGGIAAIKILEKGADFSEWVFTPSPQKPVQVEK
jgi:hypothetical protein